MGLGFDAFCTFLLAGWAFYGDCAKLGDERGHVLVHDSALLASKRKDFCMGMGFVIACSKPW